MDYKNTNTKDENNRNAEATACSEDKNDKNKPIDKSEEFGSPADLLSRMRAKKYFAYFLRNNMRSRKFFYHAFINWVGRNNWKNVDPKIRNAWEEAISSFDKQYGIIKSLKEIKCVDELFIKEENKSLDTIFNDCVKNIDKLMELKKKYSTEEIDLLIKSFELKNQHLSDEDKKLWELSKDYLEQ